MITELLFLQQFNSHITNEQLRHNFYGAIQTRVLFDLDANLFYINY